MGWKRFSKKFFCFVLLFCMSLLSNTSVKAAEGDITRISKGIDNTEANDWSTRPSITSNGRYIVFESDASNLVIGDNNQTRDVFVYDRLTDTTSLESVSSHGTQASGNDGSFSPSISENGRYIAFGSEASYLVDGYSNTPNDFNVYLRDRFAGITTRITPTLCATRFHMMDRFITSISADGRFTAFSCYENLAYTGDTNNGLDVFVYDRDLQTTVIASVNSEGVQGNGSVDGVISANGRYVVFWSASTIMDSRASGQGDLYRHDLLTGETALVTLGIDGLGSNNGVANGVTYISSDGHYIAFNSLGSNLVSGDTNGKKDVFLRDMQTGIIKRISVANNGDQIFFDSDALAISDDGLYILYGTYERTAIEPYHYAVYLYDVLKGSSILIHYDIGGVGEAGFSSHLLSGDGRFAVFSSWLSNIVVGDTNASGDIFLIETGSQAVPFLNFPFATLSNFAIEANGYYGKSGARVMSWFDHNSAEQTVSIWSGRTIIGEGPTSVNNCATYDRAGCYDGHKGIDFRALQENESIYPAAVGKVIKIVSNCYVGEKTCGEGYGNQVWIQHLNGYKTLYAHLKSVSVSEGATISDPLSTPIGVIGNTGNTTGTHLHFSVYNGISTVDPFGYQGSNYLWVQKMNTKQTLNNLGGSIISPSGLFTVTIPIGATNTPITLEIWDNPPVSNPSPGMRSMGESFLVKVLEWLDQNNLTIASNAVTIDSFSVPVLLTVNFDPTMIQHLAIPQLVIQQWDEALQAWNPLITTLDTLDGVASAETTRPGSIDLQAPLICAADVLEPDDDYESATYINFDRTVVSDVFDVAIDEDWFKFDAVRGGQYTFTTTDHAIGVSEILELYGQDGKTLIASGVTTSDGATTLEWQAFGNGTHFIRISQAEGSIFGCDAAYELSGEVNYALYLPLLRK